MSSLARATALAPKRKPGTRGKPAHDGRAVKPELREIEATVLALIPQYQQAKVETKDGHQYAITRHTKGVQLENLHKGQHLVCTVTVKLPRVVAARVLG